MTTILSYFPPFGFYLVPLVGIVFGGMTGTLAGLLSSRGITRRLHQITRVAATWSKGEFTTAVHDSSIDELGQLARDLNTMAEEMHQLLAIRQELAVVEERQRLARDLHDSVKQHVFANALLVRATRKLLPHDIPTAQTYLRQAEDLSGQTHQELSELIRALHPAAIADRGLGDALRDYTRDWSQRTGITVDVQIQGTRAAPLDLEETLFRVTQEALANVARHSGAQEVGVELVWKEEQVCLTIRDNGKGFDQERAKGKGMGLANMRKRMEARDGQLAITSSPDGTCVEAPIPLSISSPHQVGGGRWMN